MVERDLTSDLLWPLKPNAAIAKSMGADSTASATAQLTCAMVRQDEGAYRQFFSLYFERLLRYLLVCAGGDEDLAREALQLTFIRIVRYLRPTDSEERFWSWLTVVARTALVDEQRKRQRQRKIFPTLISRELSGQPEDLHTEGRFGLALAESLAELEPRERELIEAKYFEECSIREIAAGSSEKAIESKLSRIRRKLKLAILNRLRHEP